MSRIPPLAVALCALVASSITQASTLTRDRDPVVLEGSDVPRLTGLAPSSVVAFRFEATPGYRSPCRSTSETR
jgi:hypothetical protein